MADIQVTSLHNTLSFVQPLMKTTRLLLEQSIEGNDEEAWNALRMYSCKLTSQEEPVYPGGH